MSIQGKNHRDRSVEVLVSQASREMARGATLKFADIEQEIDYFLSEKLRVQQALTDLREEQASATRNASANSHNTSTWWSRKNAIDLEFGEKRKSLTTEMRDIESCLSACKLRKKQELARNALRNGTSKCPDRGNPETAIRADGTVDLGIAMLLVLKEIRGLREDLKVMQ